MPSQRATWRHADAASATLGCCVSAAHEPHIHRLSAAFPPQHGHSPSPRMSSVRCSFATAVPRSIATTLQTSACALPSVTPARYFVAIGRLERVRWYHSLWAFQLTGVTVTGHTAAHSA